MDRVNRTESLVFVREGYAPLLTAALAAPAVCVTSRAEYVNAIASRRPEIIYVDIDLLPQIDIDTARCPVVGIVDGGLDAIIKALNAFPWLSHVVSAAMLPTALAASHLTALHERLHYGPEYGILGPDGVGRVALLTHSVRRESRLERMREFYSAQALSSRIVASLSDVAEELVTNALYDAPSEAGFFTRPVQRTQAIELPPEHACEISYGVEGRRAFVRVRDPFGALSRKRLLSVLNRCNASGVSLDESRGGAGLGLWRVFSSASTISMTVIPGRVTDVLVWFDTTKTRSPRQLLAVHLFLPIDHAIDGVQSWFAADHDYDLMDESFTAVIS